MTPAILVTVNGQPMSAPFYSRLISVEVTDQEGVENDSCRIELNDGPEAGWLAIPDRGAEITIALGYGVPTFVGKFTVDEVSVAISPYKMMIGGKSADLRKKMKASKERHWDDKTAGDIVSEIAGEHGLSPKISGSIASIKLDWIGQDNLSDLHFLENLARRYNATFAVKNGTLIFSERGSGATAGGQSLGTYIITRPNLAQGSGRVTFSDRTSYKDVVAFYQDNGEVKRKEVRVASDPGGEASYALGDPLKDEQDARKAAESKASELKRATDRLTATVIGDPGVFAGMDVTCLGIRPGVDGRTWTAITVHHRASKSNFTTEIDAEGKV